MLSGAGSRPLRRKSRPPCGSSSLPLRNCIHVTWVLEYYSLILILDLVSDYRSLYLKSIYFFSGSAPKLSNPKEYHKLCLLRFQEEYRKAQALNLFGLRLKGLGFYSLGFVVSVLETTQPGQTLNPKPETRNPKP